MGGGLLQSGGPWHKCVDSLASMTSWGRSFQSLMVLGRNENCWYWVLHCGCENCWLCLHRCGGWSLFLIPSAAMMLLWILYNIVNRAAFLQSWRVVHFRSSLIAEVDVPLYRHTTKCAARRWMASMPLKCRWVYGSQTVHAYSTAQNISVYFFMSTWSVIVVANDMTVRNTRDCTQIYVKEQKQTCLGAFHLLLTLGVAACSQLSMLKNTPLCLHKLGFSYSMCTMFIMSRWLSL